MKKKNQKSNKRSNTNTLRIIGGEWRSRKLSFIDAQGLRPTPDRIRETLFNWLQGYIHGANCLDLFAGSGILGLEALSRGANQVDFVEMNKAVVKQLEVNLDLLNSDADVHHQDAMDYLQGYLDNYKSGSRAKRDNVGAERRLPDRGHKMHKMHKKGGGDKNYNIIFLDPPYRKNLLEKALTILCDKDNQFIDNETLIYLEHESEESFDWADYDLKVLKEASAGQVKSYLLGFGL